MSIDGSLQPARDARTGEVALPRIFVADTELQSSYISSLKKFSTPTEATVNKWYSDAFDILRTESFSAYIINPSLTFRDENSNIVVSGIDLATRIRESDAYSDSRIWVLCGDSAALQLAQATGFRNVYLKDTGSMEQFFIHLRDYLLAG